MYNKIWSARVPPKVQVFTWRLSQEGSVTLTNRKSRGFERQATCQVCNREDESSYHAVVQCPMAVSLRKEMRKVWRLPNERKFSYKGPDWLLHLVSMLNDEDRAKTLLLLWRVWYQRNDVMHGQGKATVVGSMEFLKGYVIALGWSNSSEHPSASAKGKEKSWGGEREAICKEDITGGNNVTSAWTPPRGGWVKLNTNAGYCQNTGTTSIGVVARHTLGKADSNGAPIWCPISILGLQPPKNA
jgi:hypothetical protein